MRKRPFNPQHHLWIIVLAAIVSLIALAPRARAQPAGRIPADQLIQPAALHRELQSGRHPLIFQVGSFMLFQEAHIPGSEYTGPASTPAGLQALRRRVDSLPRSRPIVLYCGCCPWEHCPNIAPAWLLLHRMGFTHVQALFLAHNFGADWVDPGYGVERQQ